MSTELKERDLVMTEHGLAWYQDDLVSPLAVPYRYNVSLFDTGWSLAEDASPATREQVEAYLKERGWEKKSEHEYSNGIRSIGDYSRIAETKGFGVLGKFIDMEDFDTAPAQLAEAILMARLLNATKP